MLLNDFDDIDKYMANARMLFSNVTDLREIENDFDFLSDEQIAAIRSFWSSFYPRGDTPNQQQFLAVWQVLYDLYEGIPCDLGRRGKRLRGHDLPGGRGKHGTGRVSGFTFTSELSSSV